jgi:hypothetical protein
VTAIAVRGPLADAVVALGAGLLVHGAARGRLPLLGSRALVALGRVSYPLYLLHQALGWWVIVSLQQAGVGPATSIAIALALAIGAAFVLNRAVEAPAMAALRAWRIRRREARAARRGGPGAASPATDHGSRPRAFAASDKGFSVRRADAAWSAGCALLILALSGGARLADALSDRVPRPHEAIRPVDPALHAPIGCQDGGPSTVILVLGQSNAASHAAPLSPAGAPSMRVFAEGRCVIAGTRCPAPPAADRASGARCRRTGRPPTRRSGCCGRRWRSAPPRSRAGHARTRYTSGSSRICGRCRPPVFRSSTWSGSTARAMRATAPRLPTTCAGCTHCGRFSMRMG